MLTEAHRRKALKVRRVNAERRHKLAAEARRAKDSAIVREAACYRQLLSARAEQDKPGETRAKAAWLRALRAL